MAHWQTASVASRSNRPMPAPKTHAEYQERKAKDEFRQKIITDIVSALMTVDKNRLDRMCAEIVEDHVKLTKTDGFYHNGRVFTNMTGVAFKALQKQPIHPSLKLRIIEYTKQCREFDSDTAKISQGFAVLIRDCTTIQGVRNALPDVILPCMTDPRFKQVERTMPEGFTLTSKLHQGQFEKTMDRVYFYLGSRLMG